MNARLEAPDITPADEEHAIASFNVSTQDLLDACFDGDVMSFLDIAIARSDARLLGQLMLAVRRHYATRCALGGMYGFDRYVPEDTRAVLAKVLEAATAAKARREHPAAAA